MTPFNAAVSSVMPTLVVDSNDVAANQLAEQLSHSGFPSDVATSCHAAHAVARARHYGVLVVFANLCSRADLECIRGLRKQAPNTWIVVISAKSHPDARQIIL
jgi:DNA-binding response OmpR family regulator